MKIKNKIHYPHSWWRVTNFSPLTYVVVSLEWKYSLISSFLFPIHVMWHVWKSNTWSRPTASCPYTPLTSQLVIFKWDYSAIMAWTPQLILLICFQLKWERAPAFASAPTAHFSSNSNINIVCVLILVVSSVLMDGSHINVSCSEQILRISR